MNATMYCALYDEVTMSILSVRLPKDLERVVPRKDRSAWVVEAIRERLRRQRIEAIARSAAEHESEELELLEDWESASAPLPPAPRVRKKAKR